MEGDAARRASTKNWMYERRAVIPIPPPIRRIVSACERVAAWPYGPSRVRGRYVGDRGVRERSRWMEDVRPLRGRMRKVMLGRERGWDFGGREAVV